MSKSKCDKLLAEKFIEELEIFLKNNEPEKALELFTSEKYAAVIPDSSWDVIPLVSSYLTMTNKLNEQPLFNCCIRILDIVAEKCCPSETVLEFLEQVEYDDDDVKFSVLLKPLGTSLTRMDDKTKAIEWCISTIRAYTDGLPLPYTETENNIQDKPHIDADVMSRRIMKVYRNILNFLEPLVNKASLEKGITSKSRNYILSLLLSLLGKPFCYISTELVDLESILTGGGRSIAEIIVTYITYLTGDSFRFLKILDDRCNQRNRKLIGDSDKHELHGNSEVNLFASEENVSDLAYAQFYYLLMELESLQNNLPRVYHPHYLIHTCFYLAKCLLQKSKDTLIRKGLRLIQILLKHVDNFSVGPDALELSVHSELFGTITKIMVYCESEKERHTALQVFEDYLKIFNLQARYLVILHLYETSNHTGLISIITNAFKSSIVMCLNENPHNPCFLGKKMKTLLSRACRLSHGSATDLIEISDEVITALNLLRFLTIRDKENATGIWDYVEELQTDYLNPLRKGIDLAHAHWKYKIKDLELQKKKPSKNLNTTFPHNAKQTNELDDSVTITVGGENLPVMPISEKIKFCEQAMNALDVMESFRGLWTSRARFADQSEKVAHEDGGTESSASDAEEEYDNNIKFKILNAALPFVNDLGWSQQAISAGAETIGYPGIVHGLFPNGGAELVQHFYSSCNQNLNKILESEARAIEDDPSKPKKTPEFYVRDAVETRLRMLIPYKKTWPQAMGLMSLPPNVPMALANLLTLVDDICYYAGDRSVDFNWYTRRVVLAGIYKSTELYMLQDNSEDHRQTWKFLERRIEDAAQLNRLLSATPDLIPPPDQAISRATEAASAAFITARNILGLNWNR